MSPRLVAVIVFGRFGCAIFLCRQGTRLGWYMSYDSALEPNRNPPPPTFTVYKDGKKIGSGSFEYGLGGTCECSWRVPMSVGNEELQIVASHNLGEVGAKEGKPAVVQWSWFDSKPTLPLWIGLFLLLVVPRENHKWQVWLILVMPLLAGPPAELRTVTQIVFVSKEELESRAVFEITIGGLALLETGELQRTYSGAPPSLCPT